jgi:hypothetical protein
MRKRGRATDPNAGLLNLKRAVGTTKQTKDTKMEGLAASRSFTQRGTSATGPSLSAFVCFVYFVV